MWSDSTEKRGQSDHVMWFSHYTSERKSLYVTPVFRLFHWVQAEAFCPHLTADEGPSLFQRNFDILIPLLRLFSFWGWICNLEVQNTWHAWVRVPVLSSVELAGGCMNCRLQKYLTHGQIMEFLPLKEMSNSCKSPQMILAQNPKHLNSNSWAFDLPFWLCRSNSQRL
jgi:hypothetical protein